MTSLSVIVIGASGDLANKKTFPALYELYLTGLLPKDVAIVGYARTASDDVSARAKIGGFLKGVKGDTEAHRAAFLVLITYRQGGYDDAAAFGRVRALPRLRRGSSLCLLK